MHRLPSLVPNAPPHDKAIPKAFAQGSHTSFWLAAVILALSMTGCLDTQQTIDPNLGRQQRQEALAQQPDKATGQASRKSKAITESISEQDLLLPTLGLINDRIFAYTSKKEVLANRLNELGFSSTSSQPNPNQQQVDKILSCSQQLGFILEGYNRLHQQLLAKETLPAAKFLATSELLQLQKQDFAYLDSNCEIDRKPAGTAPLEPSGTAGALAGSTGQELSMPEQQQGMEAALKTNDLERAIAIYEGIKLPAGQPPPYALTHLYGQALLKNGKENEALQVFKDLLARIRQGDQAQWEFKLMQMVGDLSLGVGKYDDAREQYKKLREIYLDLGDTNEWAKQQLGALGISGQESPELPIYGALLKSYLTWNPERDGYKVTQQAEKFVKDYAYSPVTSSADLILERSRAEADAWFKGILGQADKLSQDKKYQDALLQLEQVRPETLPGEARNQLRQKSEAISTQETILTEAQKLEKEQFIQNKWNQAMADLESRKYDAAIEGFRALLDTDMATKAQTRIDEAAKLAAEEDRRRAAEMFVRANRTHDLESKKKLLLGSRRLLQDILVKYPQSDLVEKVQRNLQRIEEEIAAIDPSLLGAQQTVGNPAPQRVQSAPATTPAVPATDLRQPPASPGTTETAPITPIQPIQPDLQTNKPAGQE